MHFTCSWKERGPLFFETNLQITEMSLRFVNVQKVSKFIFKVLTAIKFKIFQRKSKNMLR